MIRILIRTSRWAIWSRRLGSVAVPLLVLPILMHRAHGITSDTFQVALGLAQVVAGLALSTGLIGFIRLWTTGDRGWGRAVTGAVLGLMCLSPAIYAVVQYSRFPAVNDVTTDWDNPPDFLLSGSAPPDDTLKEQVLEAFPNAVNRNYQLAPATVFALAEQLVAQQEWGVRFRRLPGSITRPGQIIASAETLVGFRDEISVSIGLTNIGTRVALRSRSQFGQFDLGENGRRIESFLVGLDTLVSEWRRDHPQASG